MFNRKNVVVAVAAMSLGVGTFCPAIWAQNKNPAAPPQQASTAPPAPDVDQQKMEMQERMKSELKSSFNDADFVTVASMANTDEIQAARSALSKTNNEDVKNFAQHMIDDHTKAGNELKSLAERKGWMASDECDVKHARAIKDREKLTGPDFDKAYASSAVADHEDAVALFKLASEKASDPDLKDFASKILPTFESHLKMAQDLENKTSSVTMLK